MVTKTTDDPEPVAATSSKSEERGDDGAAEVEVEAAAEEVSRQELKIKPLDTPAADNNADKLEAKKSELKSPTESGNSTTKSIQQPTPRPAMMSPPATGVASTKAVATPSSSTPKVPTKSATRQRKPLPNIPDQSLADPTVIAGVNSIIALLQSYGPLSYEQLKFNMATQLVPTNQVVQSDTTTKDRLQQVLGILVELGIIHEVDKKSLGKGGCLITKATAKKLLKDKEDEGKEKEGEISKSETESTGQPDLNPVYCFGNGIPRMDVVLPSQILSEIKQSGEEVLRTQKRIEILRNALRDVDAMSLKEKGEAATSEGDTASTSVSKTKTSSYDKAKEVLKQLQGLHPEIVQDPVYAAALRMFKLKEGIPGLNEEDEERTLQNMHGSGGGKLGKRVSASSLASSADGSGKKKRKKGRPRKNSEPALKANATWS